SICWPRSGKSKALEQRRARMTKTRNRGSALPVVVLGSMLIAALGAESVPAQGRTVTAAPGKTVTVSTLGDELAYDVVEIRARAGSSITVEFVNDSAGMPHNVVFVNSESDINPVGIAA